MRILKVAQTYYPYLEGGGMPAKVRAISRMLASRGHSVTVLTADLGSAEWFRNQPSCERTEFGWRITEPGIESVYLPTTFRHRALTWNPRVIRFCRASLGRFDVAHLYGLYDLLGPAVVAFCARRRLPWAVEPMGMFRPIDRSLRAKRAWQLTIGRSMLRDASLLIATSDLERDELLAGGMPPERVHIRYNGIDPDLLSAPPPHGCFRRQHGIPPDARLVLFLSRLIPRKNADRLIEAFADSCPDPAWLVVAGPEGERGYQAHLQAVAQESGVATRVLFPGPLYGDEKKSAFFDADVFVLPSQYENFANAPVEAIACGVPVIISDACGIRTLVENRAGLVIFPDRAQLAAALSRLLTDSALYERFRAGCGEVAAELSWELQVEKMEAYYLRITDQVEHVQTNSLIAGRRG